MGNNNMVKIRFVFLCMLFFIIPIISLSASDRSEVWEKMYNRAITIDQQYAIMQNIVALDDPTLTEMLDSALSGQINTMENQMNRTQREKMNELMRLIVNELSSLKAEESAETIFSLYSLTDSITLKADCIVALGQIQAVEFAPQVSIVLRNMNFNSATDKKSAETLAYAAILSLEKMRETAGFEQVFYASVGWYSRRIRDKAKAVLEYISNDPTDPIISILNGDSDYISKELALNLENKSSASAANKNKVAVLAVKESLRYSANNKVEENQLTKLRLAAMNILISNKYNGLDIIDDISMVYTRTTDINEKLLVIQTFGINGTDEAVAWLSRNLSNYNSRQLDGNSANQTELLYIKQLINSLVTSGNVYAKPVLLEVQFSNYTPAITRLAKNAIKSFE